MNSFLGEERLMIAAQLTMAEEENTHRILTHAINSRPKSTKKCFLPKQKEFIQWAQGKGYEMPEIVTEAKVALFLNEVVVGRYNRNSKKDVKIGKATLDQYITALTSLWKYQVERKVNCNATPRGISVIHIQKSFSRNIHKERKESYYDRGLLYQHLLTDQMKKNNRLVSDYFWNQGGAKCSSVVFKGLRNRVGYLLSEQGLCRGENVREVQFPDFFCIDMEDEGPSTCIAMVIIKGRGKTNQYGKPLFSGYYRSDDVRTCAVSAVALFLFYRFHLANEPFPDFSQSKGWYDVSMFCTDIKNNTKPVSSSTHESSIASAHNKLKIISNKKTHGGRVYGRQALEKAGVDKVSSDVAGGWSTGAGEGCYGTGLSRPAMRAMAGFPPDDKVFYLPRASVTPPDVLLQQIFPDLEEWKIRHENNMDCESNFALDGFLRLLSYLRVVILQDAAVMIDQYPHPVFHHPIFSSLDFIQYKNTLCQLIQTQQNPLTQEIQRVLPELCRQIATNNDALRDSIINAFNNTALTLSQKLDKNESEVLFAINTLRTALTSSLTNAVSTFEQIPTFGQPSHEVNEGHLPVTQAQLNPLDSVGVGEQIPAFHEVISSAVSSIPEVLTEWEVGLNGRQSVSAVESKWGNKWRSGTQYQKAFSRRRILIGLISRYAHRKSITNKMAATLIENIRLQKKYSMLRIAEKWRDFETMQLT